MEGALPVVSGYKRELVDATTISADGVATTPRRPRACARGSHGCAGARRAALSFARAGPSTPRLQHHVAARPVSWWAFRAGRGACHRAGRRGVTRWGAPPHAAAPPACGAGACERRERRQSRAPTPPLCLSTQAARRCASWGTSAPAPTGQCRAEPPSAAGGARRATLCPSPNSPPRFRGRRWRATRRTCCGCARCWRCSWPRRPEASG